jgi:hypothetical protein
MKSVFVAIFAQITDLIKAQMREVEKKHGQGLKVIISLVGVA